jgi:hypothetical protein
VNGDEAVRFRVHRRNGKILHTFERYAGKEWSLVTPPSARLRRRYAAGQVKLSRSPVPDGLPPGVDWTSFSPAGGDNRRTASAVADGTYDLGDGIPKIEAAKLHRILDGLIEAGIHSIDSDGLIRVITARR